MKTFTCRCGQRLYFEDSQCPQCKSRLGWCPQCSKLSALDEIDQGLFACSDQGCQRQLRLCFNYSEYAACNRCIPTEDQGIYCDMCQFDDTIPDLSLPLNLDFFRRLQIAKRRVLHQFEMLGMPPYGDAPVQPALSFDFKADSIKTDQGWRPMGGETVYTGHANGKITINIREADSVERERLRVRFGESYRTLIGHFRHELGHYLWEAWIKGSEHEPGFITTFGDHNIPTYAEAMTAYYQNGPKQNWEQEFISAYASMHPFEDWAETTAVILNAHATLETAEHYGFIARHQENALPGEKLDQFIFLGDFLNEISRELGLLDAMPAVIVEPVRKKMDFIRRVVQKEQH